MKKIVFAVFILLFSSSSYSHSGKTDSRGGHYDRRAGVYHFHSSPVPVSLAETTVLLEDKGLTLKFPSNMTKKGMEKAIIENFYTEKMNEPPTKTIDAEHVSVTDEVVNEKPSRISASSLFLYIGVTAVVAYFFGSKFGKNNVIDVKDTTSTDSPKDEMPTKKQRIAMIKDAIRDKKLISFDYKNRRGYQSSRTIKPEKFTSYRDTCVQGHCYKANNTRTFDISRISNLKFAETTATCSQHTMI